MALSRVARNNIIIFVVMGFILLINFTNDRLYTESPADADLESHILAKGAVILTLDIRNQIHIERAGVQWQATPNLIQGQLLDQMMLAWQNTTADRVSAPQEYDQQMALTVNIVTAGQPQHHTLQLYTLTDELIVHHQQSQRWYSLPLVIFSQLVPNEVLAN